MLKHVRAPLGRVLTPVGAALGRTGVSPDVLTVLGTTATVVAALTLYGRGRLVAGAIVLSLCVLLDLLDGAVARATGQVSRFGAFLDSTLDRVADAAVFGALVLWWAGDGDEPVLARLALYCLVAGVVTSYAKARAEGLGMTADVGIAERPERLIIILAGPGFGALLDWSWLTHASLWLLAVLSTITVLQRLREVHRQAGAASAA